MYSEIFLGQELRQTLGVAVEAGMTIVDSPGVSLFIFILQALGAIATISLTVGIIVLLVKMSFFPNKLKAARTFFFMNPSAAEKDKIARGWEKVKERIRLGSDAELRLAVIEADQLLDAALKEMRVPGSTMAERLQSLRPPQLENLSDVWSAHKLRNRLVHEPSSKITFRDAEIAVRIYEYSLRSLKFLD